MIGFPLLDLLVRGKMSSLFQLADFIVMHIEPLCISFLVLFLWTRKPLLKQIEKHPVTTFIGFMMSLFVLIVIDNMIMQHQPMVLSTTGDTASAAAMGTAGDYLANKEGGTITWMPYIFSGMPTATLYWDENPLHQFVMAARYFIAYIISVSFIFLGLLLDKFKWYVSLPLAILLPFIVTFVLGIGNIRSFEGFGFLYFGLVFLFHGEELGW